VTFSALRAAERAAALLDRGTFIPITEAAADAPFVVGSGLVGGVRVFTVLTDGHVRGGTIGVRESSVLAALAHKLTRSLTAARRSMPPIPLILGFDTGGVRVQEGPRALAAASAVGVALARMTLLGVRVAAVISGPRGCFGAPAVMAGLPERVIMTDNAHWGLTGPQLLRRAAHDAAQVHDGYTATAAATRRANGDVHATVADSAPAVREHLLEFVASVTRSWQAPSLDEHLAASAAVCAGLRQRLADGPGAPLGRSQAARKPRRRDLLRYSFRGQWVSGTEQRAGLVQASLGTLGGHPALGIVVGPEPHAGDGVGIAEAAVCTEMIRRAHPANAAILTFLFCQGHAVDTAQERFGLPRALAECLRSMVAARLRGHPIVSVLGGGTYGAAYLAFAAPSHRILAMRGTSVAPMAPRVLQAFTALRGATAAGDTQGQFAELIPEIRMVESVIRLPRVLREELTQLLATTRPELEPHAG
jgi:malonate decarboxylase beta subunit